MPATRASSLIVALSLAAAVATACGGSDTGSEYPSSGLVPEEEASAAVVLFAPEAVDTAVALNDASPPSNPPERAGGAFGYSRYVFERVGDEVVTTLVEGPLSQQVRIPVSYSQLKEMYESGQDPSEELSLSRSELGELVEQLDAIRQATEKYRDIRVAGADGYIQLTDEVPNMGAHFSQLEWTVDGLFDPSRPEILLYVHNEAGEWELVGTSFVLPTQLVGTDHPEAFSGPLDNWHVHYNLCSGPHIASHSSTAEECRAQGGIWVPSYGWMIHAWVWEDNPLGVFSMWNPNIPPLASVEAVRISNTAAISEEGTLSLPIENFSHQTEHVKAGEAVVWTNVDPVPHTVTVGTGGVAAERGFDSGVVVPGQAFSVRFDQPGEYAYTCTIHPQMNGTIIVTE